MKTKEQIQDEFKKTMTQFWNIKNEANHDRCFGYLQALKFVLGSDVIYPDKEIVDDESTMSREDEDLIIKIEQLKQGTREILSHNTGDRLVMIDFIEKVFKEVDSK